MSYILCIDTATEIGLVGLVKNGALLAQRVNHEQQTHASFLQPAIADILKQENISLKELCAVAVSNGPGSYTGLRVGLAAAKGLCFALQIPLITLSTLPLMADAMQVQQPTATLFCPMIDARRMEVFVGLYNAQLQPVLSDTAVLLTPDWLQQERTSSAICFAGSGAAKWLQLIGSTDEIVLSTDSLLQAFARISTQIFQQQQFADVAYAEPFYCKAFYQPVRTVV